MAISSPLVAGTLGERFSAAGMIVVFATMGLAGAFQRKIVIASGWNVQLFFEAAAGFAGMIMCMLGAEFQSAWMVLVGHVLIGLHRSGHIFMRFAPLELNPGPRGLSIMGRMCSFGVPAGIAGPALAGHLYDASSDSEDFGGEVNSFTLAFAGLSFVGALQLASCFGFALLTSKQEPESTDANDVVELDADEQNADVAVVQGNGMLCLISGSLSWGLMLFVTVPFAAVSQRTAGLTLVESVYHLIIHDVMMWLPSSLTTRMIAALGAERTLFFGVLQYLASFALVYVATLMEAGVLQKILVWAFMLLLGVGWNQIWLAVTQMLKSESAHVQAFTESGVNLANVAFLLITFSFTNPWKQVPPVAFGCLALLLVFLAWKWLQTSASNMCPHRQQKSDQAVDPAVGATAADMAPSSVSVRFAEAQSGISVQTPASRMSGEQASFACGATLSTVAPLPRAKSITSTRTTRTLASAQSGVFLVPPPMVLASDIMSKLQVPASEEPASSRV